MIRVAQLLTLGFVVVLGVAGLTAMLSPATIADPSEFNIATDYGTTNLRTLGAPTLSLAIITAIGAARKQWLLVLPAAMYFPFNFSARLLSVAVEGYESVMLRGLLFTAVLTVASQVALHSFRRAPASSSAVPAAAAPSLVG